MDKKIALLIIYNHRYDKNIAKLNAIYKGKFTHIFHVVPFYDGQDENVIPIYENSYHFSGYVAQAYTFIKKMGFTHYYFVADDMIINPKINENNVHEVLGLKEDTSYLPYFTELYNIDFFWPRMIEAMSYNYKDRKTGAEITNILPSYKEAKKKFEQFNFTNSFGVKKKTVFKYVFRHKFFKAMKQLSLRSDLFLFGNFIKNFFKKDNLPYPQIGGYCDTFLIPAEVMPRFSQLCGAFAATDLFVEVAIPTAIVLTANKIATDTDLPMKGEIYWRKEIPIFEASYQSNLQKLLDEYPETTSFIHPVKLSRWK